MQVTSFLTSTCNKILGRIHDNIRPAASPEIHRAKHIARHIYTKQYVCFGVVFCTIEIC
jgi:hypothetical protein